MKSFEESDRYNLPHLTAESVVLDFGAHEGRWSRHIVEKYSCRAYLFEPIHDFYEQMSAGLSTHWLAHRFTFLNMGVGATTRRELFHVHGDQSGIVADGPEEAVELVGINTLLNNALFSGMQFGAVKINIEGGEFELMEAILEHGLAVRFDHLQIQFHDVVPRAEARMNYIKNMLLMTHQPIWDAGWTWCGYERKQ